MNEKSLDFLSQWFFEQKADSFRFKPFSVGLKWRYILLDAGLLLLTVTFLSWLCQDAIAALLKIPVEQLLKPYQFGLIAAAINLIYNLNQKIEVSPSEIRKRSLFGSQWIKLDSRTQIHWAHKHWLFDRYLPFHFLMPFIFSIGLLFYRLSKKNKLFSHFVVLSSSNKQFKLSHRFNRFEQLEVSLWQHLTAQSLLAKRQRVAAGKRLDFGSLYLEQQVLYYQDKQLALAQIVQMKIKNNYFELSDEQGNSIRLALAEIQDALSLWAIVNRSLQQR